MSKLSENDSRSKREEARKQRVRHMSMRQVDSRQKGSVSMALSHKNNGVAGERKSEAVAAKKTRGKISRKDEIYLQHQRDNAYNSSNVRHSTMKPSSPVQRNNVDASDCGTSSITIDAVPDALLRCNSPFLDAIFGGSADGKDLTSSMIVNKHHPEREPRDRKVDWQTRQRMASSLLQKKATEQVRSSWSTPMHRHRQEAQLQQTQKRGWSSGAGNTTSDSVSEMSLMSEFLYDDGSKKVNSNEDEFVGEGADMRNYAPENQTRIMAPNVDRLTALSMYVLPHCCLEMFRLSLLHRYFSRHISPHLISSHLLDSCSPTFYSQEVVIQGDEMVSVLASTDVLKMRSAFFFDLITAKERKDDNDASSTTSAFRPPIFIEDPSPYECAAYLESLHEGKPPPPVDGEWSYNWARLRYVTSPVLSA